VNTTAIPIHQGKTHFSKYVKRASSGETIVFGAYGLPSVMLVPYVSTKRILRQPGLFQGLYDISDKEVMAPVQEMIDSANKSLDL
jgi:antitoxin (DNA-binding transcriptional repressor) of toxin-antitoxin stability system